MISPNELFGLKERQKMETKQENKVVTKEHIVWLDTARLVAMFTLVCCHCANPFNWGAQGSPMAAEIEFWGGIYGAMLRHSVPLFVMITGALLLPIHDGMRKFLKKCIGRVFWPFAIWSVAYAYFLGFWGLWEAGKTWCNRSFLMQVAIFFRKPCGFR